MHLLLLNGRSSAGRVVVSKTIGRGFESYRPCKIKKEIPCFNPLEPTS